MRRRLEGYGRDPLLIVQDYQLEQQVSADYDGRQLLELLQNADDAAGRDPAQQPGQVWIRLTGNTLDVANTGAPFTTAGIDSLLYSNLSPKSMEPDQIGAKGLGFRAVLNWAEQLEIYSGTLRVAFSAAHARRELDKLRQGEHGERVRQALELARQRITKAEHPIAVLRCADLLKEGPPSESPSNPAANTLIRLIMKAGQLPALRRQLTEEVIPEVLVFLPHLTHLHIDCDGQRWELRRTQKPSQHGAAQVRVTHIAPDGRATTQDWWVLTDAGVLPPDAYPSLAPDQPAAAEQPYEVRVAWHPELALPGPGRLFSYFRTGVALPLPALVHGTFNLTANRQSLLLTLTNRFLVSRAAQLLVAAAEVIARTGPADPYQPLRLLWDGSAIGWKFSPELNELGFGQAMTEALRQAELFPVISGQYRRPADVVFLARPFAHYFVPEMLDTLLRWPVSAPDQEAASADLRAIPQLLASLRTASLTYSPQALLQRAARVRPAGSTANFTHYADLLRLVEDELRSRSVSRQQLLETALPALFSSPTGTALDVQSPVFLPPDGTSVLSLPGLNVIHPALATALRQAFQQPTYRALSSSLHLFNVQPYEFTELARYLLKQHGQRVKALHPALFRLYQTERGRGRNRTTVVALDQAIPLPTLVRGVVGNADTLYFGRNADANRSLCADLYDHDRRKLVGSRAALGLAGTPDLDAEVREYLHWCGVREFPRWVVELQPPQQYLDHVLRRFDYRRHRLATHTGYLAFRQQYPAGHDKGQVVTLDGLAGILANASAAAVLRWVWETPPTGLFDALRKDKEPAIPGLPASTMQTGRNQSSPTITAGQMSAFVRWQFAAAEWLPGLDGLRLSPQRMLLAPRGQQDGEFSPALYGAGPSLQLLQKHRIGAKDARDLLTSLGVNQAISDLPPEGLYQILLDLPQRNPTGSRAASLYRELATNYDVGTIAEQDPARAEFVRRGRVWCRTPEGHRYVAVADNVARYVAMDTYSPRTLANFTVLEVPTRRNPDKMQLLFGVAPLDQLATTVAGVPAPHPTQEAFLKDWENLRWFAYAILPQNSTVADKGDWLKSLHLRLAPHLRVTHTLPQGVTETESYEPYTHLLLTNRRNAWVVAPSGADLPALKMLPRFQAALADLLSNLLNAEALHEKFMTLAGASPSQREEWLAIWQGKTGAQVHATHGQAQLALALPAEGRQAFWQHVAALFRPKSRTAMRPPTSETGWSTWLKQAFGIKHLAKVRLAFEQLNPGPTWTPVELKVLFDLFGILGLTAAAYNRRAPQPVDFSSLFQTEYDTLIARNELRFEQLLFWRLTKASAREQRKFQTARTAYRLLQVPTLIPSDFQAETAFRREVFTRWAVNLDQVPEPVDLMDVATEHEATFMQRAQNELFTADFLRDFLDKTPERRSLIFFGRVPELLTELPTLTAPPATGGVVRGVFTVGNEQITFGQVSDLLAELRLRWAGHDMTIHPLRTQALPNQDPTNGHRTSLGGRSSNRGHSHHPETQALTGAIGEGLAFEALQRRHGVSQVEIKSENAAKLGRMPGTSGLGYDLSYLDARGQHFVEVKTSAVAGNRQFFVSRAEVTFGEQHPDTYEVLLITGIHEAGGPKYESLGNPFAYIAGQDFLHTTRFTVEHDTFRVRFEVVS